MFWPLQAPSETFFLYKRKIPFFNQIIKQKVHLLNSYKNLYLYKETNNANTDKTLPQKNLKT